MPLLVLLFFAARNLQYPGLYYDECIFVNAALSGVNWDYVALRLFHVPVMIMPYIGAQKFCPYASPEITAKIAKTNCRKYEVWISYSGRTYLEGKKICWRDGVRAIYCILKYNLFR